MIETLYSHKKNFILLGLTGRIGSGCSTAAEFLSKDIDKQNIEELILPNKPDDEFRKKYIIDKYYRKNWKPFTILKASDVITAIIFQYNFDEINKMLEDSKFNIIEDEYKTIYESFHNQLKICIQAFEKNSEKDLHSNYKIICEILPKASEFIRNFFSKKTYKEYTDIYQKFGDNIRLCGQINYDESKKFPKNIFTISEILNLMIKIIKKYNKKTELPTYIVIDAIRNPLEALFFKERYSAFYLIAINSSDQDIKTRLKENQYLHDNEIEQQSLKETQAKLLKSLEDFVSQNIKGCIEKSDIFIANNGKDKSKDIPELYGQLLKYICLIKHPGLITPSLDEKMMQIAYTAKLNSACLSRQVGASVTNKQSSLKSIGWNSVADGQTPCLLRSASELLSNSTSDSYSYFEKSLNFKKMLNSQNKLSPIGGLNDSFCFKTIYTDNNPKEKGNQVHTRSLHAEENAFLQLAKYGGEALQGGVLYSTASPCELCSKKAYQLGIERIVYIDPYPGIAMEQILQSGTKKIEVSLFSGAIGSSYHKLYEQLIPFKDELNVLMERS